ncbi:MAG TPA: DUF1697 domain-containing protein [Bacteroidales bacterium]|nr:DUF1697 domain-containing protein [Bacteroidales bacterium]HPS62692.1 DUF1697 domain-containing protein [Bacteroidales bacterium]
MAIYISILRGINVSGKNMIKMETLRKMYEALGFTGVSTYLQSGNVVFGSQEADTVAMAARISGRIREEFGYEVPVLVLTPGEIGQVIAGNPFPADPSKDPAFLHITFLSAEPASIPREAIDAKRAPGEEIAFHGKAVYLYCPNGYGNTKLHNTFLEKALKVTATTRNWKTTRELERITR